MTLHQKKPKKNKKKQLNVADTGGAIDFCSAAVCQTTVGQVLEAILGLGNGQTFRIAPPTWDVASNRGGARDALPIQTTKKPTVLRDKI